MIIEQLESIKERFEEVSQQITRPEVVSDMARFKKISKEYRDLEKVVNEYQKFKLVLANLDEAKNSMMQYLKNYSPMPGIFINGSINDIDFQKIQLTNKAVIAFLNITGTVNVNVDGLQ